MGTSGIVEPMSESAIADTIALELRQLSAAGAQDDPDAGQLWPGFSAQPCAGAARRSVKCANFIGAALDGAVVAAFVRILLVGHRKAGETGRRRDEYPLPRPTAAWSCCAPCCSVRRCGAVPRGDGSPPRTRRWSSCRARAFRSRCVRCCRPSTATCVAVGGGGRCWRSAVFHQYGPLGQSEGAREVLAAWQ